MNCRRRKRDEERRRMYFYLSLYFLIAIAATLAGIRGLT